MLSLSSVLTIVLYVWMMCSPIRCSMRRRLASAIHAPPLAHSSSLSVIIIIRLVILKQITLTCFAVLLCGKLIEKKNSQYLLLLNLYLFYYE